MDRNGDGEKHRNQESLEEEPLMESLHECYLLKDGLTWERAIGLIYEEISLLLHGLNGHGSPSTPSPRSPSPSPKMALRYPFNSFVSFPPLWSTVRMFPDSTTTHFMLYEVV